MTSFEPLLEVSDERAAMLLVFEGLSEMLGLPPDERVYFLEGQVVIAKRGDGRLIREIQITVSDGDPRR